MTLNVPLSPETAAKLHACAAAAGKDVADFVREVVEAKLAALEASGNGGGMSAEQWSKEWHAWAASHPQLDTIADDDRGSIYAGRGE